MNNLLSFLQTIHPLSQRLVEALQSGIQRQELPARHLLLQPGRIAHQLHFVQQGLVHGYNIQNGKEVSSWFMREGDFVISVVSFFMQQPSTEYIQLLEPSIVHSMSLTTLHEIYTEYPEFNLIGRILTEKYYVLSEQRAYALRAYSASERYRHLLDEFPDIFQRVAVKHIASYLGIVPETLSRLRSNY